MPKLEYSAQDVPLTTDPDGTVRVRGTRVLFDLVVRAYWNGATPEDMVRMYDTLDPADIYLVIGFYSRNRAACDDYLQQRVSDGAEIRARWRLGSRFQPSTRRCCSIA